MNDRISLTDNDIKVKLNVEIFREGDAVVIYCPALELSTYGEPEEDMMKLFEDALLIFLEETLRIKTLEHELIKLGWKLSPENYEREVVLNDDKIKLHDKKIFETKFENPVYAV